MQGFIDGWSNAGDEGILQATIEQLGPSHEYIVSTSLPFTLWDDYNKRVNLFVDDIRQINDIRTDFDLYLLGGGSLNWGFAWRQLIACFVKGVKTMNYAVDYRTDELYSDRVLGIYHEVLKRFSAITVRSLSTSRLLTSKLNVPCILSMCPSYSLKEEKFDCPEDRIAVCPRHEDFPISNDGQINYIIKRLKLEKARPSDVLLIPFCSVDVTGKKIDLVVCEEIKKRFGGTILNVSGYEPKKIKYAISKSRKVISGGRYHSLVWAKAHGVPFEVYDVNQKKCTSFLEMCEYYDSEELTNLVGENLQIVEMLLR